MSDEMSVGSLFEYLKNYDPDAKVCEVLPRLFQNGMTVGAGREIKFRFRDGNVTQFTGVKDKNAVDIYEGDILKDIEGYGVVQWMIEHCAFMVRDIPLNKYFRIESDGQLATAEVIGDIYNNPDLTKLDNEQT